MHSANLVSAHTQNTIDHLLEHMDLLRLDNILLKRPYEKLLVC